MTDKKKQTITAVRWPKGKESYKEELEKRCKTMGISESLYCGIIISDFIDSGRKIVIEG